MNKYSNFSFTESHLLHPELGFSPLKSNCYDYDVKERKKERQTPNIVERQQGVSTKEVIQFNHNNNNKKKEFKRKLKMYNVK